MNQIPDKLTSFANRLKHAEKVLEAAGKDVLNYENEIFQYLDQCGEQLNRVISERQSAGNQSFVRHIANIMSEWQGAVSAWKNNIKTSSEVRLELSRYGTGLIVAVFGRTNSGKSTLGNFIKGKTLINAKFDNPWKHDDFKAGKIQVVVTKSNTEQISSFDWFAEGRVETTREIQLFKLPGFTWVDTPGFASLDRELDGMAKKYVERADVMIYLENSENPGLKSVTKSLVPYLEQAHEVLLVINRSDKLSGPKMDPETGDFVFDENGMPVESRIPKPPEDRARQEEQVKRALMDLGYSGQCKAFSISMLLTNMGVEDNDYETFRGGNIETLFERLEDLISTDDKIRRLKFKDGRLSLINLISDIRNGKEGNADSLKGLIANMSGFGESARRIFDKFNPEQLARTISVPIINGLKSEITLAVKDLDGNKDASEEDLQSRLDAEVTRVVNGALKKGMAAVQKKSADLLNELFVTKSDSLNLPFPQVSAPKIKKMTEEFSYEVSDVDYVERDPDGIIENVCSWFGATYYKKMRVMRTETKTVELGFNTDDVLTELHQSLPGQIREAIKFALDTIKQQGTDYTLSVIDAMHKELKATDDRLGILSDKLSKEMETY